jgi:hypothetical protein
MAIGNWDDFTDKYGFNEGASLEARDFRARDVLVRLLNEQPEMKTAGVRAVAFDRGGCHNSCMIMVGTAVEGLTDDQFTEIICEAGEVELPEMKEEMSELIGAAYDEADEVKELKS